MHFSLRIFISNWKSGVVAGVCFIPFGAALACAPLEGGLFRQRPFRVFGFNICDSCDICHNYWRRWRCCPRKDERGLQSSLNLRAENFYDDLWQAKSGHAEKLLCLMFIVKPTSVLCSCTLFPGLGLEWQVEWWGWDGGVSPCGERWVLQLAVKSCWQRASGEYSDTDGNEYFFFLFSLWL